MKARNKKRGRDGGISSPVAKRLNTDSSESPPVPTTGGFWQKLLPRIRQGYIFILFLGTVGLILLYLGGDPPLGFGSLWLLVVLVSLIRFTKSVLNSDLEPSEGLAGCFTIVPTIIVFIFLVLYTTAFFGTVIGY